jgi:nucleotide-binding universal stress UspA family protein
VENAVTAPQSVSLRHVLVPLDGSDRAAHALRTAAALALRFGADLHTVSAAADHADAERLRLRATSALGDTAAAKDQVHVVVSDDPVDAIDRIRDELGSAVVCLATRGRGRISGTFIGSVAQEVIRRSRDPIVAVGRLAEQPPQLVSRKSPAPLREPLSRPRLVACVDGSTASETILPTAAAWANALTMSLEILTVADPSLSPLRLDVEWTRRYGPNGDVDGYVRSLVERWRDRAPDVTGVVAFDPISPAEGVRAHLDEEGAGLVAVTTHARQGPRRLRFGATAADIVRISDAPVLLVPLAD